jgi:hypothetical protein
MAAPAKKHREGAEYVGLPAIHPSTTWWVRRSMSCDEAVTSPVTQQGLNKNSITRHHVPSIVNAICAGQGPFRGYRCRSQSRQVRVYTAAVVGSSPAGPTHLCAGLSTGVRTAYVRRAGNHGRSHAGSEPVPARNQSPDLVSGRLTTAQDGRHSARLTDRRGR